MQASRAISHRLCVPPCLSLPDTTTKSPSWDSGRSEDVRMQHEPLLWGWAAAAPTFPCPPAAPPAWAWCGLVQGRPRPPPRCTQLRARPAVSELAWARGLER